MTELGHNLTFSSKNPSVPDEVEMLPEEAEMFRMLRKFRCQQGQGLSCLARITIGITGVSQVCPVCGSRWQTYPETKTG